MMRIVTIVAAVTAAGCGNDSAKPAAESLEGKTAEQQCEALAPRLQPCVNEVIVAQAVSAGISDEIVEALGDELRAADRRTPEEAGHGRILTTPKSELRGETIAICMTSVAQDPAYAQRVLQCWDEKTCESFVACAKP
jgi:hypothetical protein